MEIDVLLQTHVCHYKENNKIKTFPYAAPQLPQAALQVVAKLLAPIKQSQISSEGGGNSIVYFPLTGSSNISTYDEGGNM